MTHMTRRDAAYQRRSAARVAIIGWVAWCCFIVTAGVVTGTASLDRYRGVCPGPGERARDWAFELFPFAQTCVVDGMASVPRAGAVIQTAVVALSLFLALAVTTLLLSRRRLGELPPAAALLLIAQAAGIILAGAILLAQPASDLAVSAEGGFNVGLAWTVSVALGLATAITIVVFGVLTFVRLGRSQDQGRQTSM